MAPKQRQIRMEQRGGLEAIQALEQRSDEELESETKFKSAALAILGARAAERFDAEEARGHFQRAIGGGAAPATSKRRSSASGRSRRPAVKCLRCGRWACSFLRRRRGFSPGCAGWF